MPVSGAWRLTYSLESTLEQGGWNYCLLSINGDTLDGSVHETYSDSSKQWTTGGRVVTLEASAGDKIEVKADTSSSVEDKFWHILFCAEFIPKM